MSTGKVNAQQMRFVQLARLKEDIFHTADLATLWDIRNPNTLYTTLKRYVQSGLLFRIHKGMYSLIPQNDLDPVLLGVKAIHGYTYISTETVLFREGIINQRPQSTTMISSHSRKFRIDDYSYTSRQLNDQFLFNSVGIEQRGKIRWATVERAAADLLYFNSKTYFDTPQLLSWNKVKEIQDCLGYKVVIKEDQFDDLA